MDIYRSFGLLLAALFFPLILLLIYKAVPSLRLKNPKGRYIAALVVAATLIVISVSPLPEKLLALALAAAILLLAMARDMKMYRKRNQAHEAVRGAQQAAAGDARNART